MGIFGSKLSSAMLEREKKGWIETDIKFNGARRAACLGDLDKFLVGKPLRLAHTNTSTDGFPHRHFFVCNDTFMFSLGPGTSESFYTSVVEVSTALPSAMTVDATEACTHIMRKMMNVLTRAEQRMRHVLGMNNPSLAFRNSEHVANYVFRGRWWSTDMDDAQGDGRDPGPLYTALSPYMSATQCKRVGAFPSTLRAAYAKDVSLDKIYPFLDNTPVFTGVDYYLDDAEGTWNYLVIGPMGAGKSRMVNSFFNARVCDEAESLDSVTKEICFLRGEIIVESAPRAGAPATRKAKIVLIDTIGLCDDTWSEADLIRLIKGRVQSNTPRLHGVLVLCPCSERLTGVARSSIKSLLDWMQFTRHRSLFNFALTKADRLQGSPEEVAVTKTRLTRELADAFGITRVPRLHAAPSDVPAGPAASSAAARGVAAGTEDVLPVYFTSFPRDVPPHAQEEFQRTYRDLFYTMLGERERPLELVADRGVCRMM